MGGRVSFLLVAVLVAGSVGPVSVGGGLPPGDGNPIPSEDPFFHKTGINNDPHAVHRDVVLVDEDGDGQETTRFADPDSHDHDHTRVLYRDEGCTALDTIDLPRELQSIWWNTTNVTPQNFTNDDFLSFGSTTVELTWGLGSWRVGLQVEDDCQAIDWTNFTVTVVPSTTTLHATAFETPLGDAWELDGLWQVTDACDVRDEDGAALAFTRYDLDPLEDAPDCDYDTDQLGGERVEGAAMLRVDLTDGRAMGSWDRVVIDFQHQWEVQNYSPLHTQRFPELTDHDVRTFETSTDGGDTWTTHERWDDETPTPPAGWVDDTWWDRHTEILELEGPVAEDELLVRWRFDSRDRFDNDHMGWFVDDVTVEGLG